MTGRVLIEVAVESVEDALAAEAGGADRLELCSALDLGGLTPSLGTYLEVRAASKLPVWVMIRPRPGDFVYSESECRVMARDVATFCDHDPAGFVFGVLDAEGKVAAETCRQLRYRAGLRPCVFHRAFDRTPDLAASLDRLIQLGFRRVLTSGGAEMAIEGVKHIAAIVRQAAGRIEVLPCGRVRADVAPKIVQRTGCDQLHGSFSEPVPLGDGRGHRGYPKRTRTSAAEVAATRKAIDAAGAE